MVYRAVFPRDVFNELNRLQREFWQSLDTNPNIRGSGRGGFPPINVGSSERAVDIYVFAPGLDPATIDVQIEKGVLTISGERNIVVPNNEQATTHIAERFTGRFRRVVSLPDDIDPSAVSAKYRDGLLHIGVARREAAQPRRIAVQ
ncbi:MAG: Hsp20/alpha crystallin family protein [Betaproteobacteria bacterium]|nr:Hsp20/alpha crystallin family protein [Betaproteobacteria bacterium]